MAYPRGHLWLLFACVIIPGSLALTCSRATKYFLKPGEYKEFIVEESVTKLPCPSLMEFEIPEVEGYDNFTQWKLKVKPEPPASCSDYVVKVGDKVHKMLDYCGPFFKYGINSTSRLMEVQLLVVNRGIKNVRLNVTTEPVCGGSYNETGGTITSPNYSDKYYNEFDCMYNIIAPKGYKIELTCPVFELEERLDGECSDIFSVVGEDKAVVTHYCGHDLENKFIKSDARFLTINFQSDQNENFQTNYNEESKWGFTCNFEFVLE